MQEGESESGEGAVRVRHILYSPNDDPAERVQGRRGRSRLGQGRAGRQRRLRRSSRPIPRSSTRSPARRATRGRRPPAAASCPYFSTADAVDPAFAAAIHQPGPRARPAARAGQVGLRLARDPDPALPDGRRVGQHPQGADRGRQAHVRRRGARQLRQGRRRRRAATWAGSAAASSTRSSRTRSSRRRWAGSATRSRSTATASTCSRCPRSRRASPTRPRRPRSRHRRSRPGTPPRRRPSTISRDPAISAPSTTS